MPLLRLLGVSVAADDLVWLVSALRAQGDDDLADLIERAVTHELLELSLAPDERDGILAVLGDCPDGLASLRGKLARDHDDRLG